VNPFHLTSGLIYLVALLKCLSLFCVVVVLQQKTNTSGQRAMDQRKRRNTTPETFSNFSMLLRYDCPSLSVI
jgi:hypothetical protein